MLSLIFMCYLYVQGLVERSLLPLFHDLNSGLAPSLKYRVYNNTRSLLSNTSLTKNPLPRLQKIVEFLQDNNVSNSTK